MFSRICSGKQMIASRIKLHSVHVFGRKRRAFGCGMRQWQNSTVQETDSKNDFDSVYIALARNWGF